MLYPAGAANVVVGHTGGYSSEESKAGMVCQAKLQGYLASGKNRGVSGHQ